MMPRKYYEVTDGDFHVGYVSEEYVMQKYEEKILTGKAVCDILVGEDEAVDVEPVRHGRWERHYSRADVFADLFWHCSECGYKNENQWAHRYHKYCPNCGAKMDGGRDDADE